LKVRTREVAESRTQTVPDAHSNRCGQVFGVGMATTVVSNLQLLLQQARELRDRLSNNRRTGSFGADDIDMEIYNDLAKTSIALVPGDPVLGEMVIMPDAHLKSHLPLYAQLPPAARVTERLERRLTKLINRLELLLGERREEPEPTRPAWQVLRDEKTGEAGPILAALERLVSEPHTDAIEDRDFDFVSDRALREVLKLDHVEAQVSFRAGAFKATSLLAGGLLEGMLLDTLQSSDVVAHDKYGEAVEHFPRAGGEINWDRVSLTQLVEAAVRLSLLTETEQRLAEGARDYRDTVHPKAEVRQRSRAKREEAELLLALVRLTYRKLDPGHGEGTSTQQPGREELHDD